MITMPPAGDCTGPLGAIKCGVGGAVGDVVGSAAGGAIDAFVQSLATATVTMLSTLATIWMRVPSPLIAEGDRPTGVIASINADLAYYTFGFAMIGVLYAAGKMGLTRRGDAAIPAIRMMVNLIVVCGAGAAVVSAAIGLGDAFAPWIVNRSTGGQFSTGAASIITANQLTSGGSGIGLVVGLAALLGSIAQILFMIFRGAMLTALMCVLPTIAATSATEGGTAAFRKACGWLLAFVLYKPVAAVVYAVGFKLLKGDPVGATGLTAAQNTLMQMLTGLTVILCAALTLPSLVKFLVPLASAGVSSMFSGAAVGAAVVATGAAIVTMGGSAAVGGAAATGGAGTGGAGTSGAGTGGAAAGGATPVGGGGSAPAPAPPGPTTGGPVPAPAPPGPTTGGPVPAPDRGSDDGSPSRPDRRGAATDSPDVPQGGGGSAGEGSTPAPPPRGGSTGVGDGADATSQGTAASTSGSAPPGSTRGATTQPGSAPVDGASGARRVAQVSDAARAVGTAAQAATDAADEGGDGPSGAQVRR